MLRVACPACQKTMHISFANPKPIQMAPGQGGQPRAEEHRSELPTGCAPSSEELERAQGRGKLVQLRGMFKKNISFDLCLGDNVVGRQDSSQPSHIMIEGDPSVSRRSICIHVQLRSDYLIYTLRVMKCANPVLVQGREMQVGEETFLNFGDVIQLGQTRLRFEKM